MPSRLKLIVAYDGRDFAGWQSQTHGNTIQDNVERAFRRITGRAVRVHGAGRTDAGVHALAQCAHVDLDDRRLSTRQWASALNANLPATVRVLRSAYVSGEFHSRYSAKGKVYRYRIWLGRVLPPLELGRAWHVSVPIDVTKLKSAAKKLVGRHDFRGFAANRGKIEKDTVRTLTSVRVRKQGSLITIDFEGDGFLYKMVRLMAGALVKHATGKIDRETFAAFLRSRKTSRYAAPAAGLFLMRIRY